MNNKSMTAPASHSFEFARVQIIGLEIDEDVECRCTVSSNYDSIRHCDKWAQSGGLAWAVVNPIPDLVSPTICTLDGEWSCFVIGTRNLRKAERGSQKNKYAHIDAERLRQADWLSLSERKH
jgi:hypothetical protein